MARSRSGKRNRERKPASKFHACHFLSYKSVIYKSFLRSLIEHRKVDEHLSRAPPARPGPGMTALDSSVAS